MNRSDARVIGTSAATAAVVALVTVIVYQGRVKATGAGQPTMHVEPGSSIAVPPRETARDTPTVGAATPNLEQMKQEARELQKRIFEAEQALAARGVRAEKAEPAPAPGPGPQPTPPGPPPAPPGPGPTPPGPTPPGPGPQPTAPAPASCDADALAEKGRELFATGQLAAALQSFEQAYACTPDPSYAEKAFIAACNLSSASQARVHWARLPPASRQRVSTICARNGISEGTLNAASEASAPSARLKLSSSPSATVYLDDRQVGKTPLEIEVEPGRRRVRFEIGVDRYTFTVNAEAGKTVTLDKALR